MLPQVSATPGDLKADSTDLGDEALLRRIAEGDERALRAFAGRHAARGLAVAQRIVGNPSDAEEIVQDAMLRVWRHAGEWQDTGARISTWLYRIVANLALDTVRRKRLRYVPIEDAGDPVDPAPGAQMLAESRELADEVMRAIAELPARQRVALTLCFCDGMECAEAASLMQISVSAMESLLVRGRRTVRARLRRRTPAQPAHRRRNRDAALPSGLALVPASSGLGCLPA
jgi:RNA polymerase sigma-70 factor (ECF subfamily)